MIRALCLLLLAAPAAAQEFRYNAPGELVAGSGRGRADERVYVPGMRFPIQEAPAYLNSQVWGHGGSQGPGGGQCDAANFSYPWWDNYCESRQWDMPLCPAGSGHQGQDIRATTCENRRWWTVAAEDGTISSIGGYSVNLMTDDGTRHRYLHMDPGSLAVREGQRVRRGDRMGLVSNAFGGTPTTVHLHYDIQQNVNGHGVVYVPTYLSLVRSYEELLGRPAQPCAVIGAQGGVIDDQGPCFQAFGPPATWRTAAAGEGGSLHWTYAWVNDTPGNWARWTLHLAEGGRYRLAVNVLPEYANSQRAEYGVRHAGREETLRVDLSQRGPWVDLGEFEFAAGGGQWIAVYDNSGEDRDLERRIIADAVRVTPVEPDPPPPRRDQGMPPPPRDQGAPPPPPDMGVARDATPVSGPDRGVRPPQSDAGPRRDRGVGPLPDATPWADAGPQLVDGVAKDEDAGCATGCRAAHDGPALLGLLLIAGVALRRRRA